jgi:excisionase family DNA binding protein
MRFDPPLSIIQAAAALNISRTAVYEILARGEMTAVKLNGKTLIRSTEHCGKPDAFQPPLFIQAIQRLY